jgi:hypothetical protein
VSDRQRRHSAAVLLIVTTVMWLHEWIPALFVAAFVLWVIVHHRLEGDLGDVLLRRWRRAWPPKTLVLVPLLLAGTLVYWRSNVPITVKVLPVMLNVIALALVILGRWAHDFLRRSAARLHRPPAEAREARRPGSDRATRRAAARL